VLADASQSALLASAAAGDARETAWRSAHPFGRLEQASKLFADRLLAAATMAL
jgi:hypothetical protein